MIVVEGVVHHPSPAMAPHDAGRPEQSQGVRHGVLGDIDDGAEVADAQLPGVGQRVEHAQPGRVAEQAEQIRDLGGFPAREDLSASDRNRIGVDQRTARGAGHTCRHVHIMAAMSPDATAPPLASVTRRSFLVGSAALGIAACGGKGTSTAGSSSTSSSTGAQTPFVLAMLASSDAFVPGKPARLAVSIADADGVLLTQLPPSLDVEVTEVDGSPVGAKSAVAAHGKGLTRGYFPVQFTPPTAGNYELHAAHEGTPLSAAFTILDAAQVTAKQPGQPMVPLDTPTIADQRGVELLCTATPKCPLHDVTLREALTLGGPVAFLISTPQFCQVAICGPVLDVFLAQVAAFPNIKFLHSEVYPSAADAQAGVQKTVEAITAYGLTFEPCVFVARADGTISSRLDTIFDETELRDALTAASI